MANKAYFRGVPFYIDDEIAEEAGRRLSITDLPYKDYVHIEDMGGKNPRFNMNGFIVGIGDNFISDVENQLEALKEVFNKAGAGILEIPHKNKRYTVLSEQVTFTKNDFVNMYKFSIFFIISEEQVIPVTISEQQLKSLSLFGEFKSTLQKNLDEVMGWVDSAYRTIDELEENLKYATNAFYVIEDFKFMVASVKNRIKSIFSAVLFAFDDDKENTEAKMNALDGGEHYQAYIDVVSDIASLEKSSFNTSKSVTDSFIEASQEEAITIEYVNVSKTKIQNGRNLTQFSHAMRQLYIASVCVSVMQEPLKTRKEAIYYRSKISDLLDSELDFMSVEVHTALTDLVNVATTYLTNTLATLLPVVTIEGQNGEFPALFWCNRLYGKNGLNFYDDMIARNNIADPVFMPLSFEALVNG